MSWLLVAFIPGLLMLATFGLERLEAGLEKDTVTASDVAEFLEQAEPIDMRTLAREGMPEALDGLHRRMGRISDESPRRLVDSRPGHRSVADGGLYFRPSTCRLAETAA